MSQITLKPLDDGQTAVVIPLGKTTIGRGSLLGCSDKKVSRNHAVLEVTSKGEVYLTPTHVNPCFYQPTEDNPGQILKKDVPHRLEDGDSFSLLPRAYRYQLSVGEKKTEQNDLNKGKTNGSTGDVLEEDVHKEPAKGISNVEPTDTITTEKPHAKSETPSDKKPPKEDNHSLPKRSSPEAKTDAKKEKEPSPPKENNVLHKDSPTKDKEEGGCEEEEEEAKAEGDSSNHVGEEEPEEDKKGREEKVEAGCEEEPKKEPSEEKKAPKDEEKEGESCEESRDEGTLDTLPSKVSEEEEEGSKPAKRGGRKKAVKPPAEEKTVTKRKAAPGTRGRKKKSPAKFDFGPGEEGNSSQRVAGRTSSRTNRQTRQGLSLEDFVVSDDDEWQSDHSSPKRRRKKRGSRRNDESGSDWEVDHKKPKKAVGAKGGSGSESGSDWGTPKKKGGPKGKRRKGKAPEESEEVVSEGDQGASSSAPKQRIPCTYGKKCYRRSQNHVEQFSHPGDSDYASDGEADPKAEDTVETETVKKECPYGANCFRKNAQHKRDFKHTKKVRPQREAAKLADKKAKGSKNSEEVDSYDLNESLLNEESVDEYKHADSGSDYESGERTKKLAKVKVSARGGKRGRRA